MNNLRDKAADLISDKKNIKVIIVALIIVVTIIAIVLGITVRFGDGSEAVSDETSSSTEIKKGDLTADSGSFASLSDPLGAVQDNNASGNSTGVLYDAGGNPVSMYDAGTSPTTTQGGGASAYAGSLGTGNAAVKPDSKGSEPMSIVCSIAIDCSAISGNNALTSAGYPQLEPYAANPAILPKRSISVTDTNGDGRVSVEEAIKTACNTNGIQYEFKGSNYLRGINYLYEFNAGPNSGWMYMVDGVNPNRGCNTYYLNGGEDILWYYVISY